MKIDVKQRNSTRDGREMLRSYIIIGFYWNQNRKHNKFHCSSCGNNDNGRLCLGTKKIK